MPRFSDIVDVSCFGAAQPLGLRFPKKKIDLPGQPPIHG
jgi:hypothetical protein